MRLLQEARVYELWKDIPEALAPFKAMHNLLLSIQHRDNVVT
jgi:hypothetical protein